MGQAKAYHVTEAEASPPPFRVLLVEDNVDHAHLAKRGLADDEFEVTHVRTAADALEEVAKSTFHVCILDHRLPDRRGVDLCEPLRDEGFDGLLFLVTGATRDALADRAFEAGADDFVVKGPRFVGRIEDDVRAHLEA